MRTSRKTDFRQKKQTSAGLKTTFVDMTYPGQRPELPSLSRHFLLTATRENDGAEREAQGFGWDMSCLLLSQYIFQFQQSERRSLKNIRASTGFEV